MLRVGAADDVAEREADHIADAAMARLVHPTGTGPGWPLATRIRRATSGAPAAAATTRSWQVDMVTAGRIRRRDAAGDASASQPVSAVVGPQGGVVDGATSDLIERTRHDGVGLHDGVRRSMEHAFGVDLSAVRVHDDAAAHAASSRLMARAFTTGSDIFFGRGSYQPTVSSGQRLIAHELAHVVQQDGGSSTRRSMSRIDRGLVQRDLHYGSDPITAMQGTDKDLLYGLAQPRHQTMIRMTDAQKDTIHTIDEYNMACGINDVMKMHGAMGLYHIRAELASNAAWGLPLDAKYNTPTNTVAIQQWIGLLRAHAAHIGLHDLGTKGGTFSRHKIDKKDRFKKNRRWTQANDLKADRLTPDETRRFLSPAHTLATAQQEYDAMSAKKQAALTSWVRTAFFRRTSKLGQTFAITTLGAKIHMNTIADPNYDAKAGVKWHKHGLSTQSKSGKNSKDRAITVSELRNLKKLAKQNPGSVNLYGEI